MQNSSALRAGKGAVYAFLVIVVFGFAAASGYAQNEEQKDKPRAGQVRVDPPDSASPVFEASFHSLDEWELQPLSQWRGKYVVLNFWATWCKSCHHEVPELDALYDKYKDDNAVVVGIAIDNADKVRSYIEEYGVDYPVLVGGDDALALSKEMGNRIEGLPYTIVISPDGEVIEAILGATEKGTLPRVLEPILKKG